MAVGDTVPTIDPLWGEGIHKGMKSGRAAAVTVDSCLTRSEPNTSAESLSLYDELWHEEVAPDMSSRLLMTDMLYLAPNERYDLLMRDMQSLDHDTLERANEGELPAILRLLRLRDVPLFGRLAKHRLDR